jgi:hypothetical protein
MFSFSKVAARQTLVQEGTRLLMAATQWEKDSTGPTSSWVATAMRRKVGSEAEEKASSWLMVVMNQVKVSRHT